MGKRGPEPQFNDQFYLKMNSSLKMHLDDVADEQGVSTAEAIRSILEWYLEKQGRNPKENPKQVSIDEGEKEGSQPDPPSF